MKVLFDNCTAPVLASALDGYIRHEGHCALHIKDVTDLPNGRNSTDLEWINMLRSSPERWIFLTGDGRVLKNAAERAALRAAGLHGFILAPAYQKTQLHQIASLLIWKWPELRRVTELVSAPAMHEISMKRATKLRSLPL